MKKPSLIILAAGLGSRYGGLKQVEPVGPSGEIILDYTLYDAWKAGFDRAVFVIQPEHQKVFDAHFRPRLAGKLKMEFVHQRLKDLPGGLTVPEDRKKPWGTGHAVYAARNAISGPFAVANADDFYGRTSLEILGEFLGSPGRENECCLVAFRLANTLSVYGSVSRGICQLDEAGLLVSITEQTRIEAAASGGRYLDPEGQWHQLADQEPVSMNLWGFPPSLFTQLESQFSIFLGQEGKDSRAEFQLPTAIDQLIREGGWSCRVLSTSERWFGMTYREDRGEVQKEIARLIRDGVYPERLWG